MMSSIQINKKQTWLLVSSFWVIFCISRVLQDIAGASVQGYAIDYSYTIVNYSGWLFWIPLTFLVLSISRRHPIHRTGLRASLFTHLLFALLVAGIHYAFEAVMMYATDHFFFPGKKGQDYFPYLLYTLHLPILIYFLIVAIHQGFNYILKFRQETVRNMELEAKLLEAQNSALKMQIHPHFLFNTHHSIISLMTKGEKEKAIAMITRLSDLLRKTLELPKMDFVTVDDEIAFIKLYLDIQEIRFKDRLQVSYHVDRDAGRAKIPVFLLQPLVENAIVHGIEPYSDSGFLVIEVQVNSNRLRLLIGDDGGGIRNNSFKEGIGLSNIRSRLKNTFNKDYLFTLEKRSPKGTNAVLNLPLIY